MSDQESYIRSKGRVTGPYDARTLRLLMERRVFTRIDEGSLDGVGWMPITALPLTEPSKDEADKVAAPISGSAAQPAASRFFYRQDGVTVGPIPIELLDRLLELRQLASDTPVWREGDSSSTLVRDLLPAATDPASGTRAVEQRISTTTGVLIGVGCAIAVLIILVTAILPNGNTGGAPPAPALPKSSPEVTSPRRSMDDADPVGLVVVGWSDAKGVRSAGIGTCFFISPRGSALTNRHVTDCLHSLQAHVDSVRQQSGISVQTHLWVFLGGRKLDAEVTYESDRFDCAIIHCPASPPVFYPLAKEGTIVRGMDVRAVGFPGLATRPITADEVLADLIRSNLGTLPTVEAWFKPRDFQSTLTQGVISRIITTSDGVAWIEHDATIMPGNSGGPLIDKATGRVVGINTRFIKTQNPDEVPVKQALEISQLRPLIDQYVPDAVWK